MRAFRTDLLGQLLAVRLDGDLGKTSVERMVRAFHPGGILLSSQNLRSPQSTAELLSKIARALDIPPFLAIEEEGGAIDPLREFFPPLPSPRAAAEKGAAAVARLGELAGLGCQFLGFNTNLAPLLDLVSPDPEPVLGTRTFSSDAHVVARCGKAFIHGLWRHKILACGKHFPGLGSVRVDGLSDPPIIGKPMAALWSEDLIPYRELLTQLPLVMISRVSYKAYDFDVPRCAMLSANVAEGLLRVKLGYRGVAVAGDLETEARRQGLDLSEAAVQSVNAGCDLLLLRSEESIEGIFVGLKNGVESGKLSTRRLEQALKRIRMAKRDLAQPSGKVSKNVFDRLTRKFENFAKEFQPQERKIA